MGEYDRKHSLVIDPVITYSSYLGGAGTDEATGVAMDTAGNAWVVGHSNSTVFPQSGASI